MILNQNFDYVIIITVTEKNTKPKFKSITKLMGIPR